jgi:hypothetical protein
MAHSGDLVGKEKMILRVSIRPYAPWHILVLMENDTFEPIPVPLSTRALVANLKAQLIEAVELGTIHDAKHVLDIIDRLARMDWLDEATVLERLKNEQERRKLLLVDLDARLRKLVQS